MQLFHMATWHLMMYYHTKFGYKWLSSLEDHSDTHQWKVLTFTVTLTLNTEIHSFHKTL